MQKDQACLVEHWLGCAAAGRILWENHTSSPDRSSQLAQPHLVVGDSVLQQLQRRWCRAQRAAVRTLGNLWRGSGAAHGGSEEAGSRPQAAGANLLQSQLRRCPVHCTY